MNCLFCFSRSFGYIRSRKRSLNRRIAVVSQMVLLIRKVSTTAASESVITRFFSLYRIRIKTNCTLKIIAHIRYKFGWGSL